MKSLATLVAIACLSLQAMGGDFDNWYFKFLAEPCELSGKTHSEDDQQIGSFSGISTGTLSADGSTFTESFAYIYQPGDNEAKAALIWKKGDDDAFHSSGKDLAGSKFTSTLTLKPDKRFVLKSTFADGRTVESEGSLEDDGVIYVTDTAATKEGDVAFVIRYTRSKAEKKPE